MLKAILYLGLALFGITWTFISPFAGVITCIEAYLMNPSALAMTDGGFRYQLFTSVALILSWMIRRPPGLPRMGTEVWVMRLMWMFTAVGALSALWAVASAAVAIQTVYEVFKTVLLVALMVRLIQTERQMSTVVTALIVGAWHAGFIHIFGVRWGYAYTSMGKEFGVLPDPQTGVMVMFVPLVILVAIFGTRTQRVLAWCALPFVLDSIVETYERTGLVAVGFQGVLLLFYLPKRITLRLLPVIFAAGLLFTFRFTPKDYWEKMTTILNPHAEASANGRFAINEASQRMFIDYPWGVGYRNYMYVSPRYLPNELLTDVGEQRLRAAHNSYYAILCDTGIEGFLPWIGAFGCAILLLRRIRRHIDPHNLSPVHVYAMAFELGLYGWAVAGWTQGYQEVDPAYWFAGFAVVLARLSAASRAEGRGEQLAASDEMALANV